MRDGVLYIGVMNDLDPETVPIMPEGVCPFRASQSKHTSNTTPVEGRELLWCWCFKLGNGVNITL